MAKPLNDLTPKARRTRQDIITAARDTVGKKGVAGVNVLELCATAQVGRTSFYNYFDDINDLLKAVATDVSQTIKTQFDTLHTDTPRGLARLEKCLHMLLTSAVKNPDTILLMTSLAASDWPIRDLLRREIEQELKGAQTVADDTTQTLADYLTTTLLALCRDIACKRVSDHVIAQFVAMLMASTKQPTP